ncbi:MAG: hypothetical protein E6G45_12590 [Actinobacteria bacterium]|nr:MAG: hypothetical protein E6G45_12590 [Actinomycetota bacterium]
MEGYVVVTVDDHKVGKVVGESGGYLIVEQGTLKKSKHALPREFAHVDEAEQQVRMTVSKDVFCDSPKVNGAPDERAIAAHYGLRETVPENLPQSADEQELRTGITPATEERAQIREGRSEAGLPEESPALLGDRVSGTEERQD